jgi:cation-transporting P-type ATPase E
MERAGHPCLDRASAIASTGARVLLLAQAEDPVTREQLPAAIQPAALVVLKERIRADAANTLRYFADEGVAVKVISGDSPETVRAVAEQAGLVGAGEAIDARELLDADVETLGNALEHNSLFGRVAPRQKQDIVKALQARGHVVAMTGDGVNDVLAVKQADLGIALGSGAGATRAVAPLVLLDGRFATLPDVLAEGRRVTANIERVANLFITKTVWAALLAVGVGVTLLPYPFLPRHISIVDSLGIGIPAFLLALAPNHRRFVPGFVKRVVRFALPAGTIVAGCTLGATWLTSAAGHSQGEQQTAATLVALIVSLSVLTVLARPFTRWRVLLIVLLAAVFPLLFVSRVAREFYGLQLPMPVLPQLLLVGAIGAVLVALTTKAGKTSKWRVTPPP